MSRRQAESLESASVHDDSWFTAVSTAFQRCGGAQVERSFDRLGIAAMTTQALFTQQRGNPADEEYLRFLPRGLRTLTPRFGRQNNDRWQQKQERSIHPRPSQLAGEVYHLD